MDRETVEVYERNAGAWRDARSGGAADADADADALGRAARRAARGPLRVAPVLDAGCGPGAHTAHLGSPVVAVDAARAMLDLVPDRAPTAWRVQADLAALPFRRHSLRGAWASKSYVHLPRPAVPLALHDLHRSLSPGSPVELILFEGELEHGTFDRDDFPGRRFSAWPVPLLRAVVTGAGFERQRLRYRPTAHGDRHLVIRATRGRTLADTVGPDMRLLLCGLNPSVYSADVGSGFARPGNRFWPAALAAGLVTRARDPLHALQAHGIGMTDLVKRATPRADELTPQEYRRGVARLDLLVSWLQPQAVCVVGLAGWRAAVDRAGQVGWQARRVGGRPTYVMPNPSGINASSTLADLTAHLVAAAGAPAGP